MLNSHVRLLRMYDSVVPILHRALEATGDRELLDLCSGGGGPVLCIVERLATKHGLHIRARLSDKFPNLDAFHRSARASRGALDFISTSVDATAVSSDLQGFRTLFTSFHHFPPEIARKILQDAVDHRRGIGVFEFTERNLNGLSSMAVSPVLSFATTPLIRPFRWSRLLLTYALPIVPAAYFFDGVVSHLRSYTVAELQELAASLECSFYHWEAGQIRHAYLPTRITYLIGYPAEPVAAGRGAQPVASNKALACPHLADLGAYDPLSAPMRDNPYPFYAWARREAPIFFSRALDMWVITRYHDIEAILAEPGRFSSRDTLAFGLDRLAPEALRELFKGYPLTVFMINSDPPVHKRLRRVLGRGFTPRRIGLFDPKIRALISGLLDPLVGESRADLMERIAKPLPLQVILALMGVPEEDMLRVKRWCDQAFSLAFRVMPVDEQVECARGFVEYQRYCVDLLASRRADPQEDLASDLVAASADGEKLDEAELVHNFGSALVAAGHETTTKAIGNMLWGLLEHRDRWEAVLRHRSLVPASVEESLRWDSTTLGFVRTATETSRVGGVEIPAGARLFLVYGSGNRDEMRFSRPEEFDPGRERAQTPPHLTFGRGIHTCVGAPLARLELRLLLEQLLDRMPRLRLVEGQRREYEPHLTVRGFSHLLADWT